MDTLVPPRKLSKHAGLLLASSLVLVGAAASASAQTYKVVVAQLGPLGSAGRHPNAGLTLGSDGNYYGTTSTGGDFGYGTVFKMTPGNVVTILHSFDNSDGSNPAGPVIEASDGNLYGATLQGGTGGVGVVFTLARDGSSFEVLHALAPFDSLNGCYPEGAGFRGALAEGVAGVFGVVASGGCPPNTNAAFFRIDLTGQDRFHIVGFVPDTGTDSGLVRGADGYFYGTTLGQDFGRIYRISEQGDANVLYYLTLEDGFGHPGEMIQASDGKFYGTASAGGGSNCGAESCGTVFQFDAQTATYHVMHEFTLTGPEGRYPGGGLVEGSDGLLYGTTGVTTPSGADCCGTVFSIDSATDVLKVLHTFVGDAKGAQPRGALVERSPGQFLGVTYWGGVGGFGVVYKLTVPALKALTFTQVIPGCGPITAKLTLTAAALAGGFPVQLASANGAASVPATMTVPKGKLSATFLITPTPVSSSVTGDITATRSAQALSRALTVRPISVASLALAPNPVNGGNDVTGTVTLECAAAPADITVNLSSSNPSVAQPQVSTLLFSAGTDVQSFQISTTPVVAPASAKIKASANGITKAKTLTVNP